jgi:hypothetical protein
VIITHPFKVISLYLSHPHSTLRLRAPRHLKRLYNPPCLSLPKTPALHALNSPRGLCIRRVQHRVIRSVLRRHLKLNRRVALSVRARRRADRLVRCVDLAAAGLDINLLEGALEDLQRREGLVEGNFVAGLVDAQEGKETRLLDLSVYNVVRCRDVDKACRGVAWSVNQVGYNLTAKPVAVVIAGW